MSCSSMYSSDYLLHENNIEAIYGDAFLLPKINAGRVQHFNPGVEIVHVIAKNVNRVNRTEFTPGVV